MKPNSKWNVKGTRCRVKRLSMDDYRQGWQDGDTCVIDEDGSSSPWVIRDRDGERWDIPISQLKRIKPEPPALKVGDWFNYTSDITPRANGPWKIVGIPADDHGWIDVVNESGRTNRFVRGVLTDRQRYPKCDPPSTVPDGCPVDEQCHREMTEAGWKWESDKYTMREVGVTMRADGVGGCGLMVGNDAPFALCKATKLIAAWRERSGK